MAKYWVTMTDKFMSGWGMAEGKINKLVFECASYDEAVTVAKNAASRNDQKHINICIKKPYYSSIRYYAQTKTKENSPLWYEQGAFK